MKKLIIGIVIGILVSGIGAYAAATIASDKVSYDNTSSKSSATTVQGAIDELYNSIDSFKKQPFFFYKVGSTSTQGTESFTIDVSSVDKIYYKYLIGPYAIYNSNSYTTVVSTKNMISTPLSESVGMLSSGSFWNSKTYSLDVSNIKEISISITDHNDAASTGARYSQYMILVTDFEF